MKSAPAKPVRDQTSSAAADADAGSPVEPSDPESVKSRLSQAQTVISSLGARSAWWSGEAGPGSVIMGIAPIRASPSIPQLAAYWLANVAAVEAREGLTVGEMTQHAWGRACGIVHDLLRELPADQLAERIRVIFGSWEEVVAEYRDKPPSPASPLLLTSTRAVRLVAAQTADRDRYDQAVVIAGEMSDLADALGRPQQTIRPVAVLDRLSKVEVPPVDIIATLRRAIEQAAALDLICRYRRERPFELVLDDGLLSPGRWSIFCELMNCASAKCDIELEGMRLDIYGPEAVQ